MTRRVRHKFSAAVVALGVLVSPALAEVDGAWNGADISRLVIRVLAENGHSSNPEISHDRVFYPCDKEPLLKPMFRSWETVQITCTSPRYWRVAIRTNLGARAPANGLSDPEAVERMAVTLRTSRKKGEVIMAGDVELRAASVNAGNHVFTALEDVIGRKLEQSVAAGKVLLSRHLEQRWTIEEGAAVALEIEVGTILVSTSGVALEAGQIGDTIKVKNNSSGRTVTGKVVGEKKISVRANTN